MRQIVAVFFASITISFCGNTVAHAQDKAGTATPSDSALLAQNFELKNLSGEIVRLSDLRGKHILLNFWATWCRPCRGEIPSLNKLVEQYPDLVILTVTFEKRDVVKRFIKKFEEDHKITIAFTVLIDTARTTDALYGIGYFPTTFLIRPNGEIVGTDSDRTVSVSPEGSIDWQGESSRKCIESFLKLE